MKNHKEIQGMFDGKILPLIIKLGIPILISQLLQFFYTFADMYFITLIDKTSTAYLSGTGIVFPLFFLIMSISMGLSTGVSSIVARGIGSKDYNVVENVADSGLFLSFLLSILTIIIGVFFGDIIIKTLGGNKLSALALKNAHDYFNYLLPGFVLMITGNILFGVLIGEGLMKYIAISTIISSVINIILDPIFIFVLHMGVKGAGLATSISIGLSGLYVISVFIFKKSQIPIKWKIFNFKKDIIYEILRIGTPQAVGMLAMSVSFMFLNKLVSSISETVMNAWTMVGRTDQFIILPIFAMQRAVMSIIGQNFGRKNYLRIIKVFRLSVLYAIIVVIFLAIIYNLFARHIFSLFSTLPAVIEAGVRQVRFLSFFITGMAIGVISGATFQAIGRPLPSLIIKIIRMGIIAVPMAYILVYIFKFDITGVYYSLISANIFTIILAWFWTNSVLKKYTTLPKEKVV